MACNKICIGFKLVFNQSWPLGYYPGRKLCTTCYVWIETGLRMCPCCHKQLRARAAHPKRNLIQGIST